MSGASSRSRPFFQNGSDRPGRGFHLLSAPGWRRWRLVAVAVLGGFVLLLGTRSDLARASTSCSSGTTLNVVAHQDDDLLFLSPDLLHDVQSDRCVVTVFVTAGDHGQAADYWQEREAGPRAAYAQMAGVTDSWLTGDAGIPDHPAPLFTLEDNRNISLVFLRLPDGHYGEGYASNNWESLQKLWQGDIGQVNAVDDTSAYSKKDLVDALGELVTEYQPNKIRTLDYRGNFGDGDHSDHYATGKFTHEAQTTYAETIPIAGYIGYRSLYLPQNVFSPDLEKKQNAFYAYANYDYVCNSTEMCSEPEYAEYAAWLERSYVRPVANAGLDQTVDAGSTVTLDGSQSVPADDTLKYTWEQTGGTSVVLSDTAVASPTFTAPVEGDSLTFKLTVSDDVISDSASVAIAVTPVSNLSITKSDSTSTVDADSATTYTIRVANSGPSPVTGAVLSDPSATGLAKSAPVCSTAPGECTPATTPTVAELEGGFFTLPTLASGEHYEITVTADVTATSGEVSNTASVSLPSGTIDRDPANNTATDKDTLNHVPEANAGPDQTVNAGETVKLNGLKSTDPDGDTLTYEWTQAGTPAVSLAGADTATPTFEALASATTLVFSLNVTNSHHMTATDTVTITVNHAPVANAGPDQIVHSGTSVQLDGSASTDPDSGFKLSYKWEQTGGATVALSSDSASKPTFTAPATAASLTFKLTVSDGMLTSADTVAIAVVDKAEPAAKRHRRPQTKLVSTKIRRAKHMALFRFSGSGGKGNLKFECRLDTQRFSSCRVYKSYKHLEHGRHVFRVRARDANGLADLTPITKRIKT